MTSSHPWKTWEHNFPPFFTLQPVQSTRNKQITSWGEIIKNYTKSKNISTIDLSCEIFKNNQINRSLSSNDIISIFKQLSNLEVVKFCQSALNSKDKVIVLWRPLSAWADLILEYAVNNSLSIMTLFDIIGGDDTTGEPFYGQDEELIIGALLLLQEKGKCELMYNDADVVEGVKFFV